MQARKRWWAMFAAAMLFSDEAPAQSSGAAGSQAAVIRVVDTSGAPVPAALIRVRNHPGALTDSAGQARMDGLNPGSVRLQVTRIGYQPADTTVTIDATGHPVVVTLRPGSVRLDDVSASAVPDSTFVGSYSVDWHAQGGVLRDGARLEIQRGPDGLSVLWHPQGGRPMHGTRVRVRGSTITFVVTQRSPVTIRITIRDGVLNGRWESLGGSGRLTGRKER